MTSEVKLISLSKPNPDTGCDTAEELIAYAARVSNPANQNNKQTAGKLVRYLIKENHWSPLEMVHMTLEIKTSRDIARQILRHRSFSFQEFSQRYAVAENFMVREPRWQDKVNRQNSKDFDLNDVHDRSIAWQWENHQNNIIKQVRDAYDWAIEHGIAKEQARSILPEGNTESTLYMAGTLRSWIHYCDLRRGNGTQKEHMEVADKCWNIIGQEFPDIVKALEED